MQLRTSTAWVCTGILLAALGLLTTPAAASWPPTVAGQTLVGDGSMAAWSGSAIGSLLAVDSSTSGDIAVLGIRDDVTACSAGNPGAVQILRSDGTQWTPEQRVAHPEPVATGSAARPNLSCSGEFGSSVSTDGTRIAVAARRVAGDDLSAPSGGAAYVLQRNAAGFWASTARVRPPAGQQVDTVALHGARLLIGTSTSGGGRRIYAFAQAASGWEPDGDFSGGAPMGVHGEEALYSSENLTLQFMARRSATGWTVVHRFMAQAVTSPTAGSGPDNRLGIGKVLLGADTATVATRLSRPGGAIDVVELYRREATGWRWEAELADPDTPGVSSRFGSAVSRDGDQIAIGASSAGAGNQPPGAAFVFARDTGGAWGVRSRIAPADPLREKGFGSHVALGDGVVGVLPLEYNRNWGAWLSFRADTGAPTGALNQPAEGNGMLLGVHVAVEGDLAAGMTNEPVNVTGDDIANNYGAIRVFRRNAAGWSAEARLISPGTADGSVFGLMPSIRGPVSIYNGSVYAIGSITAFGGGRQVLLRFDRVGESWSMTAQIPVPQASLPNITDVDFAGGFLVMSTAASFGGGSRVDIHQEIGGVWTRTQAGPSTGTAAFTAFNPSGDMLAVISRQSTTVHLWRRGGSTFSPLTTLVNPYPAANAAVPVLAADNSLAIADYQASCPDGTCSGRVALFASADATSWHSGVQLGLSTGSYDYGAGLAALGDAFLIARQDPASHGHIDIAESNAGAWSVTGSIDSPAAQGFDYFGQSMATSGAQLVVGAFGTAAPVGRNVGTIYAYQTVASTAPPPPTGVTVVPGNHSATITWLRPPTDGGSPIIGYTVTATPGGQTCTTDHADALTCTIIGLTNGVNYTFTVTARNAVGASPPATTPPGQPPIVPGTPPGPVVVLPPQPQPGGDGTQVTLHWLPAESDLPITGYRATAQPGGHSCDTTGALSCTITGLTPGTDYSFTVVAINGVGPSNPSDPVQLPPAVTAISPGHGPQTGGTIVTITGERLTGATAVTFATTVATFTVHNDTTVTAIVPPGSPGPVDVHITTPAGTSAANPAARFTYDPVADIAVTMPPSSTTVALGDAYNQTITVTNHGPSQALQPVATLTLSGSAAAIVSATTSAGSCTTSGTTLTCHPGSLASGASATVVVAIEPVATGVLTATAQAHAGETDPQAANNATARTAQVTNAHNCTHIGSPGADTITGTNGNDIICALTGDDHVNGGNGDDIIYGGSGSDTLDGGNGNDLIFAGPTGSILIGGNGNDTITGGIGDDTIYGDNGNDTINAGDGNDTINGGNGNDTINAGAGTDTTDGGSGIDTCAHTENASSCST